MIQKPNPTHSEPAWVTRFLQHSHRKSYPAKAAIIHEGDESDTLYYIIEGSVSVVVEDEEGREIILSYLNPGEFFGEMGLFDDDMQRSAWVVARNNCELAEINYEEFRRIAMQAGDIVWAIAEQLTRRLRRTNAKVRDLAFLDVTGRVAHTLLELSQEPDAITHPDGMQIHVTRQEIARIVGCSREMVGRVLKELEDQGLISAHGKTVVVYGTR